MVRIVRFIGVLLLLVPFLSGNISAQEPDNRALSRGTINDQLDYILDKSSKYQDFKVVKETSLRTFRSNVLDTIKKLRSNLNNNQVVIASNKAQMDSVKALLQASNTKLDETFRERNSIRFLGMLMSKEAYSKLMWIIISILALVLAVFIILFKRSNKITLINKSALQETRDEFDKFRKRALEREQELSRNHLAELNKYKKQVSGN